MVSAWLFFDRDKAPVDLAAEIRRYHDELLPTDPIELAVLYTGGWQHDLHDPDTVYDAEKHDFEYATRQAQKLAGQIANDPLLLKRAVDRLACSDGNTIYPFTRELATTIDDLGSLFSYAVEVAECDERPANHGFFSGLIAGADLRDHTLAQSLVQLALKSPKLKSNAISFIGSGRLQPDDLALVIALLKSGDVSPSQVETLSYGKGLDHLSNAQVMPFLRELEQHGNDGLWAILNIADMTLLGGRQPTKEFTEFLKSILINPVLMEKMRHNMDAHHLSEVVGRVAKFTKLGVAYTRKLAKQLLSICKSTGSGLFRDFDDPVRKSLSTLARPHPNVIWDEIAKLLTDKSPLIRRQAERLLVEIHPEKHLEHGIAVEIPSAIFLTWVRGAPEERAVRAVGWVPATRTVDDTVQWHPEMEAFVVEFGSRAGVLPAIAQRLYPTSFWGSMAQYLEPLIPAVETWTKHANADVRQFASGLLVRLRQTITEERKRSEEDTVRFN